MSAAIGATSQEATVTRDLEVSRKRHADSVTDSPCSTVSSSTTHTTSLASETEPTQSRFKRPRTESSTDDLTSKMRILFDIVQNRDLTAAERNMRFVQVLGRMQLAAFKNMTWREEFTTGAFNVKICSTNGAQAGDASALSGTELPFFVLSDAHKPEPALRDACGGLTGAASDITSTYSGTRIDFQSVVLSNSLRAEINQDAVVKSKAGVSEITTLQQWAHGTAYRYETVHVLEPMPNITCPAYSAVTLVPLMTSGSQTEGLWDPFFKGTPGVKLLLTYGNDRESREAIGGGSAYITDNRFTIIQDSPIKKQHWKVTPIEMGEGQIDEAIAKIQNAAVNFAIVPFSSVGSQTFSLAVKQQVEPAQALHMKVRAIPIDICGITTETQLQTYLISLERLFIGLSTPSGASSGSPSSSPSAAVAASSSSVATAAVPSSTRPPLAQQAESVMTTAAAAAPTARIDTQTPTSAVTEEQSQATETSLPAAAGESLTQRITGTLTEQLTRHTAWHQKFWKGMFK